MNTTFLTDPAVITAWLAKHCKIDGTYEILPEGQVAVHGSVTFYAADITQLEVAFAKVSGSVVLEQCQQLQSLVGLPKAVGQHVNISFCEELTDLQGAPQHVDGNFLATGCGNLKTLKGAPVFVGKNFDCSFTDVSTFHGCPAIIQGSLKCNDTSIVDFTGLENTTIGGELVCRHCSYLKPTRYPNVAVIRTNIDFKKPTAEVFKQLLLAKTLIDSKQNALWLKGLRAYCASNDLLAAIVAFEKLYKMPFTSENAQPAATQGLTL